MKFNEYKGLDLPSTAAQILGQLCHAVIVVDPRLYAGHFAKLFACAVGIFPEVGFLSLFLLVSEVYAFLVDVKGTSPT